MEESPQPLIADRVVRGIDCLVVLAQELLVLSSGEAPKDHQRIGGVLRRPVSHETQLMAACRPQPAVPHQLADGCFKAVQVIWPDDEAPPPPPRLYSNRFPAD